MREFNCSEREAREAKDLVANSGIFSIPAKKRGKLLPADTVNSVKSFYERDDVSRIMPGLKDYLSIKQRNSKREHIQKRLPFHNLNELYILYKNENEYVNFGFTKFTEMRPQYCVLAESSGTHNVCVYEHHENVKLMLSGMDIENLSKDTQLSLKNYHDCIQAIVCNDSHDRCYLGHHLDCPNTSILRKHLLKCFDENDIFQIEYQSWFQTDRCTIASKTVNVHEFMEILVEKLMKLKIHDFFTKKQSLFVNNVKSYLQEGEFLVCCDFAENYAFVIPNSTQSLHWNNNQATVFTAIVYYKLNDELKHVSIAVISDNLNHDTITVYEYKKIVILS